MFWLQLASLTLTISPCLPTCPSQLAGTGSPVLVLVLLQPQQHIQPSSPLGPWLLTGGCNAQRALEVGWRSTKSPSLVPGDDLQSPLPRHPFCSALSCLFLVAGACAFSSSLFPKHLWKGLAAWYEKVVIHALEELTRLQSINHCSRATLTCLGKIWRPLRESQISSLNPKCGRTKF